MVGSTPTRFRHKIVNVYKGFSNKQDTLSLFCTRNLFATTPFGPEGVYPKDVFIQGILTGFYPRCVMLLGYRDAAVTE
jgi:hypothetical protein